MTQPDYFLDLLQQFQPEDWLTTTVDEIDVQRVPNGLVNRLTLVTRRSDQKKALIRQYGGNVFNSPEIKQFKLPVVSEVLVFQELSRNGYGPKLLGVFEDGRIEEYIESHTLTAEEVADDDILRDLAINTSIVHNLDIPLPKVPQHEVQRGIDRINMFRNGLENKFDAYVEKYEERLRAVNFEPQLFRQMLVHDWESELRALGDVILTFQPRIGLIVWDNNYLNVLIRENPPKGALRTCIIDYEFCRYQSTTYDIGRRFVHRLFKFEGKGIDKLTNCDFIDENKRRTFIREYILQNKRHKNTDHQVNEVSVQESEVDELLMECDHWMLLVLVHFSSFGLQPMFLDQDTTWVYIGGCAFKKFFEWKKYLQEKYKVLK